MEQPLEAHFENRIYYFTIENKDTETIMITMYKTAYIFLKQGKEWRNAIWNKLQMSSGLIKAVIEAIEATVPVKPEGD
ncbi:hypothetical protein BDE36_2497 [Arcticibacter tournemirensis]|uniref:Uncharacterized protein n=1 Tax=Arcticibacter tournemirensis TaxID=699437 RepID=A0A4Q0MBR7_9SPHI|nr:hypothetical protein [Arcticibacter tournemirensis]KAA8478236.1 hypothetical protein F1649_18035 [Arcticibacter tournemirensis]RXF70513.1 hypothetical protein EKH83_07670 [Arcticibacter tournemirensis]TQM50736.1 hypothetical protein BDE36_2497 [Arcticibacter tournemirensis]